MTNVRRIAVLGAGSWGTAIATHLARLHSHVCLWGRDAEQISEIDQSRENKRYLSGVPLPNNLLVLNDLEKAVAECTDVLIAVPSHAFREVLVKLKPHFVNNMSLISLAKGLDPKTHQLLHEVVTEILGSQLTFSVLTGPTFAKEVAMEMPTAVTLASTHYEKRDDLIDLFHSQNFRVYFSSDVIGVELGGAIKNVMAIAVGIAAGLSCGSNAQAALVTRGLAEMMRLAISYGAKTETLMGLSGLGDLILTCTNDQSRNRRLGLAIGEGKTIAEARKMIHQVIEGMGAAAEIYDVAKSRNVEMPIVSQVYHVLYKDTSPDEALKNLLLREPKNE